MTLRTTLLGTALTGGLMLAAGTGLAQTSGSAATRALNGAPPESTMSTRPDAQPPLTEDRRQAAPRPSEPRGQASDGDRALEDLLGSTAAAEPDEEATTGVTLAAGETEPEPIPMTLGYYVRGDKDCVEVWPGEGDLAFLTPTSFTIDYGGCEPGQFLQTGPNSWREAQACHTESGASAGAYHVTYEVLGTDVIKRTARLGDDAETVEDDLWNFCRLQDVPENARFGAETDS